MTVVHAAIDVEAPPERVWQFVADPRNLPHWDRHIARVERVPADGLLVGAEYETIVQFMGVHATVPARVEDIRPPRYSRIRLSGILDALVESWVQPLEGGGSRLTHRIDFSFRGGPLGALGARAVRMMGAQALLRHGMLAQKQQIERGRRGT